MSVIKNFEPLVLFFITLLNLYVWQKAQHPEPIGLNCAFCKAFNKHTYIHRIT